MKEKLIEIKNVTKIYELGKTKVVALNGIDLEVKYGEIISICGPSGSGKTTLLNLIGCLDKPTDGEIKILGTDVLSLSDNKLSEIRGRHIGFIFQTFNLIPVLTAYENVEYPLFLQNVPARERKKRVLIILEEVGLTEFIHHKPDELSGGQRQRVAIARALVTKPEILLADEPTANLDTKTGESILELMQRINKEYGTTFIFSTHDHKVLKYANKIYYLRDGKISLTED
jgi:putative ABC transport system ATP-binding protein